MNILQVNWRLWDRQYRQHHPGPASTFLALGHLVHCALRPGPCAEELFTCQVCSVTGMVWHTGPGRSIGDRPTATASRATRRPSAWADPPDPAGRGAPCNASTGIR
ncbi:MAG: hypothetical protein ACLU9S_02565 [Oscillospiraceae bacterium]